eukprot:CAMPEP_0113665102 /NCGR_PEP_ID=MMETSP0038_2-20120614/2111_1 /TAXON_ID=2898 /ORGANISM="Cryptomonas paramecium" /LENGTH=46 /DNA_ID=CAMNT_0000580403 /DNA_START=159 /DNA_END=296 /DNA_ORIENTATION=- /assembly_acc=CAM_ASM_000170
MPREPETRRTTEPPPGTGRQEQQQAGRHPGRQGPAPAEACGRHVRR